MARAGLIASIMEELEDLYEVFLKTEDLSALKDEYNRNCVTCGHEIRVLEPGHEYTGTTDGLSLIHILTTTIAGGQGFTAVLVSWMSKFNPLTMVFSSFLIIFMNRGASEISTNFGLNQSYSDILTGIILFFIIGCEFFISYQLQSRKKAEKKEVK